MLNKMKIEKTDMLKSCIAVMFIIAICGFLSFIRVNLQVLNPFKEALESYELTDMYFSFHSKGKVPVYDDMSVVLVDVSSCKTRGEVADVIERINAAEPRLVALDIIFPDAVSADKEEDDRLVEALDKIENLVLACELRLDSDSEYVLKRSFFADMIDAEEGAVSFPGKVIRSWCPLVVANGDTIPSFSKVIADRLSIPVPSTCDGQLIDYAIVDTMTLEADKEWSADFLKGQVVLVGDVNDLRDTYQVPVTLKTSVRKSGVLIHKQILHTCFSQNYFKKVDQWLVYVVSILLLLIFAIVFIPVIDGADRKKSEYESKFRQDVEHYTSIDYVKTLFYRHISAVMQVGLMIATVVVGYCIFWAWGYNFDFSLLLMGFALLYVGHQMSEMALRFLFEVKAVIKNRKRK